MYIIILHGCVTKLIYEDKTFGNMDVFDDQ